MISEKQLIDSFIKYVSIDSESGDELEICNFLYNELTQLGLDVLKTNEDNSFSNGYNMIASYKGDLNNEPVFLSAHVDTVVNGKNIKVVQEDGFLKSDGTTILGADDKVAMTAIMEVVKTIKENNLKTRPFEVVFTLSEEHGLLGAKALDVNLLKAKDGLVFDGTGKIGGIDIKTPSNHHLKIEVTGKGAHSGSGAKKGISAIQIAAKAIADINLGQVDEETTCNIGIIYGGEAGNIIPEHCHIDATVRSLCPDKAKKQINHIKEKFNYYADLLNGFVDVQVDTSFESVAIDTNTQLVKDLQRSFELNGIEPYFKVAGGGSDNNIFFNKGLNSIDVAISYNNIHTVNESIEIIEMQRLAQSILTYLTLNE